MRLVPLLAACALLSLLATTDGARGQTPPEAPEAPSVTGHALSLVVSWTAPADGGSAITSYDLHYIRSDDTDKTDDTRWTERAGLATSAGDPYTLEVLTEGVGYDVQVRAANVNGVGAWSDTSTGTTAEIDGTTSSLATLPLGSPATARIDPADDTDTFRLVLGESADLWLYTTGELDAQGRLLNDQGSPVSLSTNLLVPSHLAPFAARVMLQAGTYYLQITGNGEQTGSYVVHADAVVEPGSTIDSAITVTPDSLTPARLPRRGEHFFKITLQEAADLWFIALGQFDSIGELLDSSGDLIVRNDDGDFPFKRFAFSIHRTLDAGTYYLNVSGSRGSQSGPYTLYVRDVSRDDDSAALATPTSIDFPAIGRFDSTTDRDYFRLTLLAEAHVHVSVILADSTVARPHDLTLLDDQDMALDVYKIPHAIWVDSGTKGSSERGVELRTKLAAGTYYLRLDSGLDSGEVYTLTVRDDTSSARVERKCLALGSSQSDPLYACQWHLNDTDQFDTGGMQDINVEEVWATNKGEGINVAVVDNGLDYNHDDLKENVIQSRNRNFAGTTGVFDPFAAHGTAVAGIIAARDNDFGVRGVAPRANIFSYRIFGGTLTVAAHASAMALHADTTAVSNHSYGHGNGILGFADAAWDLAVEQGVWQGYGGKGVFYVFAGGNGAFSGNANLDGYLTHYATTPVCAVGYDGEKTFLSQRGANLWICAPSSDSYSFGPGIATTTARNLHRTNFSGTSASVPVVSGVAALLRAANEDLTWRDLKLILAASARRTHTSHSDWHHGAPRYGSTDSDDRYWFNHFYGFGAVDAGAAVALASGWTSPPDWRERSASWTGHVTLPDARQFGSGTTVSRSLFLDPYVDFIEYVSVEVTLTHTSLRDLRVQLVSPAGVTSELLHPGGGRIRVSRDTFRMSSAKHLGEAAAGEWTLRITDERLADRGVLHGWKLTAYGHGYTPAAPTIASVTPGTGAFTVTWEAPAETGGSDVSGYDVRYVPSDTNDKNDPANWSLHEGVWSDGVLTHVRGDVPPGYRYDVTVRAVNETGAGPWSEALEATVLGPPAAPAISSITPHARRLTVSWDSPSRDGGETISRYDLRSIPSDDMDKSDDSRWTVLKPAWVIVDGDTAADISSLQDDTRYDVQVRAANSIGAGDWSPSVEARTPTLPGAPSIRAVSPRTSALVVAWNAPASDGRAAIDRYDLRYIRSDDTDKSDDTRWSVLTPPAWTPGSGDTAASITGLVNTVLYDLQAHAVNSVGEGPWSATVTGTPEAPNGDAMFVASETGRRSVAENTAAGQPVGGAFQAEDPEDDPLTFAISPESARLLFDINSSTGQLLTKAALDHEDEDSHSFEVLVTDQRSISNELDLLGVDDRLSVTVTVGDVDEPPDVTGAAHVTVDENTTGNLSRYSAADPERRTTAWEDLEGDDGTHFEITNAGYLRFRVAPDFDAKADADRDNMYEVQIRASDPDDNIGTLDVVVTVIDVNEPPVIEGEDDIDYTEGASGDVYSYRQTDPEDSGVWQPLDGDDSGAFTFVSGVLRFTRSPNFEDPGDDDKDNVYDLELSASDGPNKTTLDVMVTVTNADEDGTLALSSGQPLVGTRLIATPTDPDVIESESWTWERSPDLSTWSEISGQVADGYTPVAGDLDQYLRVTVLYTDGHDSGKRLQARPLNSVQPAPTMNRPPEFADTTTTRSVRENSPGGARVGTAVPATDPDGDSARLTYTLTEGDTNRFTVDAGSGQLRVREHAVLDYEDPDTNTSSVTITATDPSGATGGISVAITVTDVNEAPVADPDTAETTEDKPVNVEVLDNDSDPDANDRLRVRLGSSPANGSARVETDNTVTYTPKPDYHGGDSFTYTASDGSLSATGAVSVTILSVNDAPEFPADTAQRRVSPSAQPGANVGAAVTATDVDGDVLGYRLSGSTLFEIEPHTAQITVAAGAVLDPADQPTHTVTVTATEVRTDPLVPLTASVDVTITVTTGPVGPTIVIGSGGGGGGGGPPPGPTPSDEDFEWTVTRDIEELDSGHDTPSGMWSDHTTLWIAENGDGADDAIYAYDLASGERVEDREFELDDANLAPRGLWSDRTTIWVSDSGQNKLFAHDLGSGERLPDSDIALASRNRDARGIWSGGSTMWVLDDRKGALFGYDLASGELLAEYALDAANDTPHGLWSDRVTIWVSNHDPKLLFAYRLPVPGDEEETTAGQRPDLERVRNEEFGASRELTRASNNSPRGIWSDGEVMYVADESDDKVYSYNMPDAIDARLASLSLSGVEIGEFSRGTTEYEGVAADGVTETTVEAEAAQDGTSVVIEPPDTNPDAEGYQVALAGVTEIAVTVTSADGSRERVYRVRLSAPEPAFDCFAGGVAAGFSLVAYGGGSADDLEACARGRHITALYALAGGSYVSYIPGAPDPVNRAFIDLYPDGLPSLSALLAQSDGPPSPAPTSDNVLPQPWPNCLRGAVVEGFSLVVYEGGSVADLEACARSLDVAAVYALQEGEFVSYIVGAPESVNQAFGELYAEGLPALTPLVASSDAPASAPGDGDGDVR